ncbi:hypothetical protein BH09ACT6_BH09ACT6_15350 [soil metagenome]
MRNTVEAGQDDEDWPDSGAAPRPGEEGIHRDRTEPTWVTDLTFVLTWPGVAYVCFIIDAFS